MAWSATRTSDKHRLDRRRFLGGAWLRERGNGEAAATHRVSATILVHTRPERLAEAEQAIAALDGVDVLRREAAGRLTVTVAASNLNAAGATLNAITMLPGVSAAVFATKPRGERPVP